MTYVRPPLAPDLFLDDAGVPIPYGNRWDFDKGPPDEAYSVTAHPERFAPLVVVADALVEWLQRDYDVRSETAIPRVPKDAVPTGLTRVRSTRLVPGDPEAAPLTVTISDFPGVEIEYGNASSEVFPRCGCDACDEGLFETADELERAVRAVIAGTITERMEGTALVQRQDYEDGWQGTTGRARDRAVAAAVRAHQRVRPDGSFAPWRARA